MNPWALIIVVSRLRPESILVVSAYPQANSVLTRRGPVRNLPASFPHSIPLFSIRFSLNHETHLPAQPSKTKTYTWFSRTNVYPGRTFGVETPARERASTIVPLGLPGGSSISTLRDRVEASFGRRERLIESNEFTRVFRNGRRSVDVFFTVLYLPNSLGYPRLGLAVAKKNVRHAVRRNRLKRLARESFRLAGPALDSLDIVVLARHQADPATNSDLFVSLQNHWRRVGSDASSGKNAVTDG